MRGLCRALAEVLSPCNRGSGGPGKGRPLGEEGWGPYQESQEHKAAAERYKSEVARLEALLAEKDLALNQTQADLAAAQSQVARWHRSLAEHEKRAEGRTCVFYLDPFCTLGWFS